MKVRVGWRETEERVPTSYQVAVFPAFGALAAQALFDLVENRGGARMSILATTSCAAVVRLAGLSPWSGHASFLAAALVHELCRDDRTPHLVPLAALGLAVTLVHKRRWSDLGGGVAATVAGALLGAFIACRAPRMPSAAWVRSKKPRPKKPRSKEPWDPSRTPGGHRPIEKRPEIQRFLSRR